MSKYQMGEKQEERKIGSNMFSAVVGLIKGTSRWRKASKCKSLMKQLKIRLANQKSRKMAVIKQSRADIAQLFQKGQLHIALSRVEQLYKDQSRLSAYDQLDVFCDCILENFCHISRQTKLSVEVVEALSSLIFGASRCGELPELHSIRCVFKQHFGLKFERSNVELLHGNAANVQLIRNLDTVSVAKHIKLQLLQEIKEECSISSSISSNQERKFIPEIKKHDEVRHHQPDQTSDFRVQNQASKFEEMLKKFGKNLCFANYANLGHCDGSLINWHCSPRRHADHDLKKDKKGISTSPSSHVHPKLPEYDEIATKFANLKKKKIRTKKCEVSYF